MGLQSRSKINNVLQNYLNKIWYKHPILFKSLQFERKTFLKYHSKVLNQMRILIADKLNPFNVCPRSIYFWFLIQPYNAIGISILGLREVGVHWRQQIEPNETVYLLFKVIDLKPPFPLTLLLMFSALGLIITDGANRLIQTARLEFVNQPEERIGTTEEQEPQGILYSRNSFSLTPRMSIYFPIFHNLISLGFLTIDMRHLEISIEQVLEPNETILSIIRFLDLNSPFPLQLAVLFLSVGLFLTGQIYNFGQTR